MNENFDRLALVLSKVFKVPASQIRPESRLKEDLRADSLDAAEALMEIEQTFGIIVPEREKTYHTVNDIRILVEELIQAKEKVAHRSVAIPDGLPSEAGAP